MEQMSCTKIADTPCVELQCDKVALTVLELLSLPWSCRGLRTNALCFVQEFQFVLNLGLPLNSTVNPSQ